MTVIAETSQKDLEALIVEWADAWTANDKERLLKLFTDDCIYDDVPMNMVSHGKEGLEAFADFTFGSSQGFTVELKSMFVSGNRGAMEWVMSATPMMEMPGLPFKANQAFAIRGASICEFKDGKIHRQNDFWDSAAASKPV